MHVRVVLPLLLVPLLAGCSGKDPAAATQDAEHGDHEAAMFESLEAPTWALGDWWTWSSPQQESSFTYVVSGESGNDWSLDTDSPDVAFFDARSDISFLGKVRKSDLAGSQGDARVEFFRFPLTPHKTWSTTWDGEPISIHVAEVKDGVASLEANRSDGSTYAKYTYVAKTGYFGAADFYSPDGQAVAFESKVTASGHGFSGQLVRWAIEVAVEMHGPIPQQQTTLYNVPATVTDVYVVGDVVCTAGAVVIASGPPQGPVDNRGYSVTGQCPIDDHAAYVAALAPAQDEQWGLVASSAPSTVGTVDLTIWLRTLSQFPVGEAPV